MKKILIFMLLGCFISTQALASGSPSAKQTYLKKNFTAPTTSNYDPMDVFGILTFYMQYSEVTGKYNYEVLGFTWEDMAAAISGNPDVIFVKLPGEFPNLIWKTVGNSRVLTQLEFYKKSLTGIFDGKYFKNLQTLTLFDLKLTSIDISKNTNLVSLDCTGNQLTKLDVSHNSKLQSLYLMSSKLNYIDISKNINLVILSCSSNQLTNLDISKNINLKELYMQYNELKSLDVSKNTNLEILVIDQNPLTSLDISKNTNLKKLYCDRCNLKSLDTSKNPNLEYLNCNGNQLTSLDVSNNPKLKVLFCHSNFLLTTLDLSKNPNLEELQCYENQLKFSTLKGNFSKLIRNISKLGPQARLEGGTKGFFELIDLSSEYNINGTLTTFKWYDKDTNQEVTMFAANGTFYASPTNAGKTLICKMTNALYPDFRINPNLILEYEVTITNSMTQSFSAKTRDFKIPDNFTLTGPEAETSNLKIYPNPVTDVLKINTPSQIESVSIYDYSGNEVKKVSPVINKEVNLQGLSSGNYILTVKTNQGTITKKIIKK